MQAIEESVEYQRRVWDEDEATALRAIEAAGVQILRPDKRPFQEAVAPLYSSPAYSGLAPWIQRIRALANPGGAAEPASGS
jgi:TRAP-type C4-dicarboxylate transport system substrate-binding protein